MNERALHYSVSNAEMKQFAWVMKGFDRLEGGPQGFACRNVDDRFSELVGVSCDLYFPTTP
jgi:hypothetical protein